MLQKRALYRVARKMSRVLKNFPFAVLELQNLVGGVDFGDIFGRLAPVHIEIGSGKGTFLVNQAKSQPDVNFIGIEWANRFYRFAVDRIGRWNMANVRIIRTDAVRFIAENVPDSTVDCFHVYFPDPWPKKRHHKRRFFNPVNTDHLIRCLKPAGEIRVATDFGEYFEQIKDVLSAKADRLQQIDFLPTAGAGIGEWVGTNFERKYLKENRPIFTVAVRKV
jgi:tRNA (guanine-N7-)-methyltransferase